jgi:hypothetical protein
VALVPSALPGPRAGTGSRTPGSLLPAVLAMTVVLAVSGCTRLMGGRWDATRRQVIEPINATFHKHLPRYVQARDLEALAGLYATDRVADLVWEDAARVGGAHHAEDVRRFGGPAAERDVREHWRRILDLFPEVDKAELRIARVHWEDPEPEGLPADVRLLVRGGDGTVRRQLDQSMRIWIAPRGGPWRITRQEVRSRELVASAEPFYEVATAAAGIDDVHDTAGSPPFRIVGGAFNSSGGAVGDVDGDGIEDVILVSASRLTYYRNRGDGTFEDATAASGLPAAFPGVGTGALLFDYDNDGRPDLYVASIGPQDRLYRNEGGVFRDVTAAAGILPGRWASMVAAADYDRDGHLDLFVARMGDHESVAPQPNYDAENALPDTLYRNNGDGTFADVAEAAGVASRSWALVAAWGDYDGDGWPDLYVGNEFGRNKLFRNLRDGTFRDVSRASGTADRGAAMGLAWGDVDGDGHLDLFVSNMYANSSWLLFHPDFPRPVPWYLRVFKRRIHQITDEITRGSTLLLNNGDGTFTDASDAAGVRDAQWGWGAELLDYNNDGLLDLYTTNGFVSGPRLDDV